MAETIVFYPKWTTLIEGTYYSDPYDVTAYKSISAEAVMNGKLDTATATGQFEESSDLETWSNISGATLTPTTGTPATRDLSDTVRYIRLKYTIAGGGGAGAVTLWAKAVAREN